MASSDLKHRCASFFASKRGEEVAGHEGFFVGLYGFKVVVLLKMKVSLALVILGGLKHTLNPWVLGLKVGKQPNHQSHTKQQDLHDPKKTT